jgi:hypothetical protein
MSFPGGLALGTRLSEVQAFGYAFGNTGRLQALVHPVHAEIAFDGFAGFGIPLGGTPGTCRNAGLASDAEFTVDKDNTVFGPFLHCASRTGGDTPGILTMKARHKDIGHAGKVVHHSGSDRNDLGQPRPNGQMVFGFAMRFTAETSDAAFAVLVDIVLAHTRSSKLYIRLAGSAFNVQG